MKKIVAVCLLLVFLTGCGILVEDSYLSVEKHSEQPTEPTESTDAEETVISNRNELRGTVLSRIRDWVEYDLLTVRNYDGDLQADLTEIVRHATDEDPIGAYAVDFIDAQLSGDAASGSIELSIVFRRSAAEVDSIITVSTTSIALRRIQAALTSYETALTLRIRNYEQTDFIAEIRDYCLKNLNIVAAVPETSAAVYPPTGETRILELHFTYPATRETMSEQLASANTILTSAANYIKHGESDSERLELLANFLTTRFQYRLAGTIPSMPAYELLCEHVAHSTSFAAVFRYECALAGIDCWIVSGEKDGLPYDWNIVSIDGVYYHVDLMRSIERNESGLNLLHSWQLQSEGYTWDAELYPDNPDTEPYVPQESTSTQSTEPTESTQEAEPTEESTQEPEPSESEENN